MVQFSLGFSCLVSGLLGGFFMMYDDVTYDVTYVTYRDLVV